MRPKALMIIAMLLLFGLVGCTTSQEAFSTQEYILTTGIHDGGLSFIGVSGEINGVYNPKLSAEPGQTITITLINGGYGKHNFSVPDLKVETKTVTEKGELASITFTVPEQPQEFEYYDTLDNHSAIGMHGIFQIGKPSVSQSEPSGSTGQVIDQPAFDESHPVSLIQ